MTAVQVRSLTKNFARLRALDDVSFEIPTGSLFGLLGPNGAGKTTLFSIAAGFLKPSAGSIEVLGIDVAQISLLRGRFSMLPQDAAFQGGIPVIEQLVMFGRLNGFDKDESRKRAHDALELVGLGEVARKSARALSHGMMKRVALCQAFLGDPEVIFLDEPTSGLDPDNARKMRDIIRSMHGNKTVVVSSHNLQEIQDICDHAAILHEGVLEACESMANLTSSNYLLRVTTAEGLTAEAQAALSALDVVRTVEKTRDNEFNIELNVASGAEKDLALKRINKMLVGDLDLTVRSIREGASLEARFLDLTGGTYDGASST